MIFLNRDIATLLLQSLDVKTLLALRLTGQGGVTAVRYVFLLSRAVERVPKHARRERKNRLAGASSLMMIELAIQGELRLMQWARQGSYRVPWDEHVTAHAAAHGHVDMIFWMHFEADPPAPVGCKGEEHNTVGIECTHAAKAGRLDVLKWLLKHGFPMVRDACIEAAKNGNFDIVKYTCCLADPPQSWLPEMLKILWEIKRHLNFTFPWNTGTADEVRTRWTELYKERVEKYMRILNWYVPFADVRERERIFRVIPMHYFDA